MSIVKKFFTQFDLFCALPTLRFRGQSQAMSLCGGIISFLLLVVFTYVFIINLVQTIQYQEIQIIEIQKKFYNGKGQISGINFAVGVQAANYQRDIYPYGRFEAYIITREVLDSGQTKQEKIEIKLQPCRTDHYSMLNQKQRDQIFEQYKLFDRLCPVKGQNISVKNTEDNQYYEHLQIALVGCTTQPGCMQNAAEHIKIIEARYSTIKYFQAKIFILDTGFNSASKDPTFLKIKGIRATYSTTTAREVNIYLSKYEVNTDFQLMPWEKRQIESGYYVQEFFNTDYEYQSHFPLVMFMISFSDQQKVIKRTVGKIDQVLSYTGGLFAIIISFLGFFLLSYNEYRYQIMVAEGAFNYNDDGKKLREEDFTFIKYVKYSFYDWIQLLGCCELNWEDCEEIAGTRKEANNQLDVSLLFKKIQHLERAVEYMMSEKEEICLYLTEPPSLNEVRRKRKLSEYYDKVIQGNAAMTVEDVKIKDDFSMVLSMGVSKSSLQLNEGIMRANTRFKENVDKTRINIVEYALEHYLTEQDKIEDDSKLDELDKELEIKIAEAFFHMKPEKKAKIQEKIPLKILYKLQNKLQAINSKQNIQITFD